jgi:hypothetical protein
MDDQHTYVALLGSAWDEKALFPQHLIGVKDQWGMIYPRALPIGGGGNFSID